MKKDVTLKSKLQLSRETLHALEQSDLREVAAAITTISCELGSCNGCNTRNTCTTRYC